MEREIVQYDFPTTIRSGPGARHELADALRAAGVARPLIVTDATVAAQPFMKAMRDALAKAGLEVAVFDDAGGNPVRSQVVRGVEAFAGHGADAIVAVGGGAPLDVAKAIALMAHHPGDLFDYQDGRPVEGPIPYLLALPTTAGTGSEVGRSTVISDDDTRAKKIIFSPRLLPRLVLADPELLLGLPPGPTAATGMDALTHLVESFLARGFHPICDGIALEGVRLVDRALRRCVEHARAIAAGRETDAGDHLEARWLMLTASMMGAIAFQKGLGVTHSCAHALSTVADLHHGLANGVMLPTCLNFNLDAAPERLFRLARLVDPKAEDGADFIDWVQRLNADIGIPSDLETLGVHDGQVEDLVEVAVQDGCHPCNPRPVTADDFRRLFYDAMTP